MEEGPVGGLVNLFFNRRGVECGCIGDPKLIEGDELSWEGIEGEKGDFSGFRADLRNPLYRGAFVEVGGPCEPI